MLSLLFLLPAILAESFWMTAELLRVDWREGCLTTAGCSQPRFKVLEDMLPITEKISISWPISEHFVQDASRSFVSHWAKGKPEDLTLTCQVVGTDPTYGFPRVCDQTATIRVFQEGVAEAFGRNRRHQDMTTTSVPEEELGKKLIEIQAKCFNATLAVQKHTERCPWCPDPSDITLIEQRLPEDTSAQSTSLLSKLKRDEKLLHVCILLLAGIAVLASLGFACVLVAFLRQKRTHRHIYEKPRHHPLPSTWKTDGHARYDMPWEQTRPLTCKLSPSSKSEATTTSPLDSVSSLRGSPPASIPYGFRSGYQIHQVEMLSPFENVHPVPHAAKRTVSGKAMMRAHIAAIEIDQIPRGRQSLNARSSNILRRVTKPEATNARQFANGHPYKEFFARPFLAPSDAIRIRGLAEDMWFFMSL